MPRTQRIALILFVSLATLLGGAAVLLAAKGPAYTDPKVAAEKDPDFVLQGEYLGEIVEDDGPMKFGAQVVALGGGKFVGLALPGGLPGDGWVGQVHATSHGERGSDGSVTFAPEGSSEKAMLKGGVITIRDADGKTIGTLRKVNRKSPTEGAKAPSGAVVLFDGTESSLKNWSKGKMDGGFLTEGTNTKEEFGSFKLHLEFRLPYKPQVQPSNQDRGNSGVYTFNRYETQLLDSFGLHYNDPANADWKKDFQSDWGYGPKSDRTQWCACFYKFKTPDVNASYPPLAWQTYDITFTAPKFEGKKKVANARITVVHNGVTVQDDVEMVKGGTGAGGRRGEIARGGIYLQGHGNPVRFRNVWIQPLD